MKKTGYALALGPVLTLCLLLVAGCSDDPVQVEPEKAADFILKDLNGSTFQLSKDAGGKVVLLNFFNAACGTCQLQTTELVELYHANQDAGLLIVGVSHGSKEVLDAFVEEYDVPYRVLRDTTEGLRIWNYYQGVQGTPGIYIIDKDAVILGVSFNRLVSFEELDEAVKPLL